VFADFEKWREGCGVKRAAMEKIPKLGKSKTIMIVFFCQL
jgi:hypothetical protein